MPTGLAPTPARPLPRTPSSVVGRIAAPDTVRSDAFTPGTIFAERYRIIGLLGRGGMGEVYRADDLKLGQAVALKFLPQTFAEDPTRLERFYSEVRIARQISHPNVCRTYDIGEHEGRLFLSMEYVDGEDLASLLRRIRRLPRDKALEIAQQLCAGLAAAHDRGVLHRDLKPSNVMIDGRGRAIITDFGLAAPLQSGENARDVSGTPAYMAPEQLTGKGASVQSDLYALGLVLYELHTGRRAFDGATLSELVRQHAEEAPAPPSSVARNIDPAVEKVILKCLEKDPAARPSSASRVAAQLPGGDPLAAALAAGETPSPAMVAAYGGKTAVALPKAAMLLAVTLLLLAAFVWLPAPELMARKVPLQRPPEFLSGQAQDLLSRVGAPGASSSAQGFTQDRAYLQYVSREDRSPSRWSNLSRAQPGPILFWYRASPKPLVTLGQDGEVTEDEPPESQPGMVNVMLDPHGRLLSFRVVPEPAGGGGAASTSDQKSLLIAPDWKPFFVAAGLDPDRFRFSIPQRTPRFFADTRYAWEPVSRASGDPVRIEAASLGGQAASFELIYPWSSPKEPPIPRNWAMADVAYLTVVLIGWIGAIILARRNWRLKRGDRRGAFRIAMCLLVASMTAWLLRANHTTNVKSEWELSKSGMGGALFWAATLWVTYLALEPFVRARWPRILVSWNRLLAWDFRDPLVGRDVLIGAVAGIGLHLSIRGEYLVPLLFGRAPSAPMTTGVWSLGKTFGSAGAIAHSLQTALTEGLGILVLLLLFRMVLRKHWLADAVLVLAISPILLFWDDPIWVYWPLAVCRAVVWIAVLVRVGLLSFVTGLFFWYLLFSPINLSASSFYASRSALTLLVAVAIAVWAFVTAVGGRVSLAREQRVAATA
jgi:serine/threonine-protein kinase